ncbi:branched-chain amino acid ABC transporter permease [Zoogloea ramigera]|uniref:branched-chain amino acid ABC transporter permease n=1 Tax=Zoogloea ramigera TaxID=350 RepID=UPI001144E35D|nr:branched-chain amino acid ABC transporter permease [Zoogloea ramigera]
MDAGIVLILGQDGVSSGAIYALLALALVLIFSVTRVIFIPQGEFVAFGALTLAMLQAGKVPATVWLLVAMGAVVAVVDGLARLRDRDTEGLGSLLGWNLAYPLALAALLHAVESGGLPMALQILLTLAILVPLGPMIYRIAYQPIAETSVLVLLIASVAVHLILTGLGLVFFGAEGVRTAPFSEGSLTFGEVSINLQTLWVVGCSLAFIVGLAAFFTRSLYGKALRATSVNPSGAKLMGISPVVAGKLTFLLAALLGVFSGVLIGPITTIYYDTGFLIGLKGFVAAIIGGLASYPLAAAGAVLVGLLESFSSFWASAFKEVLVFTLIIPVLLWRSFNSHHVEDEE